MHEEMTEQRGAGERDTAHPQQKEAARERRDGGAFRSEESTLMQRKSLKTGNKNERSERIERNGTREIDGSFEHW